MSAARVAVDQDIVKSAICPWNIVALAILQEITSDAFRDLQVYHISCCSVITHFAGLEDIFWNTYFAIFYYACMYILYVCKYIYVYIYTHVYVLCMQRHPFWCFYPIHTMPRRMWPSQPQQALRRPSKAVPPGRCWTRQSGMAKWLAGELLSSFPVNLSCELCTTYSWKCLWHNYSWAYSTSWKTLVNGQRWKKKHIETAKLLES